MVTRILRLLKHRFVAMIYKVRTSAVVRRLIVYLFDKRYRDQTATENELCIKISNQIKQHGYYHCSIDELLSQSDCSSILLSAEEKINELISRRDLHNQQRGVGKNYVDRFSEFGDIANIDDPLIKLSVDGIFRNIAECYFKSLVRITNLDYWLNVYVPENETPFASQKWHRDYEDCRVLKAFFYINDVTDQNGPFFYVSESQLEGNYSDKFPTQPPLGIVVDDDQLEKEIPKENVLKFTPNAGSVLLVDTAGLHKGGRCLSADRKIFTATFTSFAGISKRNFNFTGDSLKDLASNARAAVSR